MARKVDDKAIKSFEKDMTNVTNLLGEITAGRFDKTTEIFFLKNKARILDEQYDQLEGQAKNILEELKMIITEKSSTLMAIKQMMIFTMKEAVECEARIMEIDDKNKEAI